MTTQAQTAAWYACVCGFKTPDKKTFTNHFTEMGRQKEERGKHKSYGRINPDTGEKVMGPWKDRTPEEKAMSSVATPKKRSKGNGAGPDAEAPPRSDKPVRVTDVLANAAQLRFVPKMFNTVYTPIMMNAQLVARDKWNWGDMSLEDFLDTVIYLYFKEHGIILAGYIELDEEENKENGG